MNERQEKQARFSAATPNKLRNRLLVGGVVVLAAAVLGWGFGRNGNATGGGTLKAHGGKVAISLAEVSDGQAHFYRYQSGDKTVSFFVVRGNDGKLRAALDTCDVCFEAKKGYRQQGEVMICNNCDQQFPTVKINEVSGGCNPVGLPFSLSGEQLAIDAALLDQGARYF